MKRLVTPFHGACICRRVPVGVLLALISVHLFAADFATDRNDNWHQWRGPGASGVARNGNPPLSWSSTENVLWRTPIDGHGSSTPIVWGDRVFLLTSIRTDEVDPNLPKPEDQPKRPFGITYPNVAYQFVVICLDRNSGRELWRRVAAQTIPHEGHHGDNNFASASPTTDGERLYVWFGPVGMFCYDLDGELLWHRDLGKVSTRRSFGEASSPVIHGDRLIINRDHEGQSYIAVLDAKTGKDVWRAERDELSTWMTPLVVKHGERTQLVTSATNRVRSYDLSDGSLIWQCGGQVFNVTPSPVTDGKLVFCMSGYRGSSLYALPLDSTGDITDTERIAWKLKRGTPYVPSPLLMDGLLYFNQSNDAIISAVDAKTGEIVIERTRMPGLSRVYASPVGAAGRVYFTGRGGTTLVLKHGRKFEVLATNSIGEPIDASPTIVGRQLFLRGRRHLYCIAE
jgi:outer membrane protein assembly factor BamB